MQSVPSRTCPPPPGNFLHFLFSEVAFSAFSGKNSAQNLINYIKILTAILNFYQSCSNSNDPLNILHECCDTNLLMISFNYMSTKRGGSGPPGPPPTGSAPDHLTLNFIINNQIMSTVYLYTYSQRLLLK